MIVFVLLMLAVFGLQADQVSGSLVFFTHERVVFSVAFSPDGSLLAAASLDGSVSLWRTQGILRNKIRLHDKMVLAVAFSPDGKRLASSSADGTIAVFDHAGKLDKRLAGHVTNVISLAWSPNGRHIASGADDRRICIHEPEGKLVTVLTGQMQAPTTIEFTPDGSKMLVSERGQHFVVYDTKTWRMSKLVKAHQDVVWDLSVSRDGKLVATGSKDKTVRIWDFDGKKLGEIAGFTDEIWTLSWSPDGKKLACGLRNGEVVTVDALTYKILRTEKAHTTGVPGIAWSPTGALIATGSRDGTIRVWQGL